MSVLRPRADDQGGLSGFNFQTATTFLRWECISGERPGTTEALVSPWIVYGDKRAMYQKTPTGLILVKRRPQMFLTDLRTGVTLREGQVGTSVDQVIAEAGITKGAFCLRNVFSADRS